MALVVFAFFMRLSSRIWCDFSFAASRHSASYCLLKRSILFPLLFFGYFSRPVMLFFPRSFLRSVASNFVIKRFSSVVFLRVINILLQKVSENVVAFVMNTFICFKWVTFFTLFDFVHSIRARLCQLSDCHVIFNDTTRTTNEEERIKKEKRIRAADRFVPNVINFDMVHFPESSFFVPNYIIFLARHHDLVLWCRTQSIAIW